MQTLAERIARQGALPSREAAGWVIRLAKRIESLHAIGVIHGRVSADCIRAEADSAGSRGVLVDMRYLQSRPAYHSPERTEGAGVSQTDDTWGVAVVLYFALTGRLPFGADTDPQTGDRILAARAAPLAVFGLEEDALQRVLDGALARERTQRTVKIGALRRALEGAVQDPSIRLLPLLDDDTTDDEEDTVVRGPDRNLAALRAMKMPETLLSSQQRAPGPASSRGSSGPPPLPSSRPAAVWALNPGGASTPPPPPPRVPTGLGGLGSTLPLQAPPPDVAATGAVAASAASSIERPVGAGAAPAAAPSSDPTAAIAPASAPSSGGTAASWAQPVDPRWMGTPSGPGLRPAPSPSGRAPTRGRSTSVWILPALAFAALAITAGVVLGLPRLRATAAPTEPPPGGAPEPAPPPTPTTTASPAQAAGSVEPPTTGAAPAPGAALEAGAPAAADSAVLPSAPAVGSVDAPPSSDPAEAVRCMLPLFSPDTFEPDKPPELGFVCTERDPRKGGQLIRAEVVRRSARAHRVSEGMREWASLGWYELPAFTVLRTRCCASPPPMRLPTQVAGCPSIDEAIAALGALATTKDGAEKVDPAIAAYADAVQCIIRNGASTNYGSYARPQGGEDLAFKKTVLRAFEQ